jgi:hypothetical protein
MAKTLNERQKESEETIANLAKEFNWTQEEQDVYKERDENVEKLADLFYQAVGLGKDDPVEFIDLMENETGLDEQAGQARAMNIPGWVIYLGEEVEYIWKDGLLIGKMVVSARGQQFIADYVLANGESRRATDEDPN